MTRFKIGDTATRTIENSVGHPIDVPVGIYIQDNTLDTHPILVMMDPMTITDVRKYTEELVKTLNAAVHK